MSVTVRVKRLPHGEGLPLPSYQSGDAAGLDVVAGVPEGLIPEILEGIERIQAQRSGRLAVKVFAVPTEEYS